MVLLVRLVLNFAAPFVTVYMPEQSQGILFFYICDELQHPEHTSIIRDPYSYDDRKQMAVCEELALPGNSSYESCIVNSCLSTTNMKLFRRELCYGEVVRSRKGGHLWHVHCLVFSLEYTNSAQVHPAQALFSHSSQSCLTAPHFAHMICCSLHMCSFALEF